MSKFLWLSSPAEVDQDDKDLASGRLDFSQAQRIMCDPCWTSKILLLDGMSRICHLVQRGFSHMICHDIAWYPMISHDIPWYPMISHVQMPIGRTEWLLLTYKAGSGTSCRCLKIGQEIVVVDRCICTCCTCICDYVPAGIHVCIHTRMHTCMNAYIRTCAHTHTCMIINYSRAFLLATTMVGSNCSISTDPRENQKTSFQV